VGEAKAKTEFLHFPPTRLAMLGTLSRKLR
jgi:hypothetical protein